jgi:hypothetical protein
LISKVFLTLLADLLHQSKYTVMFSPYILCFLPVIAAGFEHSSSCKENKPELGDQVEETSDSCNFGVNLMPPSPRLAVSSGVWKASSGNYNRRQRLTTSSLRNNNTVTVRTT